VIVLDLLGRIISNIWREKYVTATNFHKIF
jgi:hypothetical protein